MMHFLQRLSWHAASQLPLRQELRKAPRQGGALFACGLALIPVSLGETVSPWSTVCDEKPLGIDGSESEEEDDDDEFDFHFAQPPVAQVELDLDSSVNVKGGLRSASWPTADLVTSSCFALPVERGWPRDVNRPEEVATFMCEVIADRLPRWVADDCRLDLIGAPLRLRSTSGWPVVGDDAATPAELRWSFLPAPLPPLITLRRLQANDGVGFLLGGLLCAGRPVILRIACESRGVCSVDGEERLDLRVTTSLEGFPIAGRAWFVGARWWFKRVRLPTVKRVLQGFHVMLHEQMMVHYVAALSG